MSHISPLCCHWAEFRYAECRYAVCHYAVCRYAVCRYAVCQILSVIMLTQHKNIQHNVAPLYCGFKLQVLRSIDFN